MESQAIIERLNGKIRQLIALYESSERARVRLGNLVVEYEEQLTLNTNKISELEKQIETLQLIEAFREGESGELAKKRVSELIREIDKCIALLNG